MTKPVEESLQTKIATIEAALMEAERLEKDAEALVANAAGLAVLGEIGQQDEGAQVGVETLAAARKHTSALRSALGVLEGRIAAQNAAQERERVDRLRQESDVAAKAQSAALGKVEQVARQLTGALEVVKSQGAVLDGLHAALTAADPLGTKKVADDHRAALDQIAKMFAAKRGQIRNDCASANYRYQASSDGVDRALETDLVLGDPDEPVLVAEAGTRHSIARQSVLDYELSGLARLDQELHAAQQEAFLEHASRAEVAGLGSLSCSLEEIRTAANLPENVIALLISDQTARALAGLPQWLPASANSGVSVRSAPSTALDAKQEEARLQAGLAAIRSLVAG